MYGLLPKFYVILIDSMAFVCQMSIVSCWHTTMPERIYTVNTAIVKAGKYCIIYSDLIKIDISQYRNIEHD